MRDLTAFNAYRRRDLEARFGLAWLGIGHVAGVDDPRNGMFQFRLRRGGPAFLIFASTRGGWEHLSITITPKPKRCPTWEEMEIIKREFFEDHETAMQLHVPKALHVNVDPYCLHIWRPRDQPLPVPPVWLV